jgi:hypothetical protein
MSEAGGQALQVIDNQNGSMTLTWPAFAGTVSPDSYNVYVNGVLNQTVTARTATVSGLTACGYSSSQVAPVPNNSSRPQNMPPNGVVTDSGTYDFKVVAVKSGVEIAATLDRTVTVSPTSVMLTTPMKRPFPFPNTSLD